MQKDHGGLGLPKVRRACLNYRPQVLQVLFQELSIRRLVYEEKDSPEVYYIQYLTKFIKDPLVCLRERAKVH